jgi:ectoine hydroxylase-related dioxygenase (phytanoyl-CoA dioxygenase family)
MACSVFANLFPRHLDPQHEECGFPPHRDREMMTFSGNGSPHYVTLWLALSDATLDNGCIQVLPAHADPEYTRGSAHDASMPAGAAVALPAPCGTVLGWSGRLLHAGGRAKRHAASARVSLACAASAECFEDPCLRLDCERAPDLRRRVALVATQFWAYEDRGANTDTLLALLEALEGEF